MKYETENKIIGWLIFLHVITIVSLIAYSW